MNMSQFSKLIIISFLTAFISCKSNDSVTTSSSASVTTSTYTGTGSLTQGLATTTISNLFPSGIRIAGLGTITSSDGKTWTVPADVNFTNTSFPTASDLYNSYISGHSFANSAAAVAALSSSKIVTIDSDGEVFSAYIFGDNYFELYVNGVPVGKDPVPFTDFNSCIVQFKAKKPFTVAVKCVDWEENLGLGSENSGGSSYYIGDGGFVMHIKNASGSTIDITNNTWKAQTFYTSPISDLACVSETGNNRLSTSCNSSYGASNSYGIHWAVPANWFNVSYDDSSWPAATTFTNSTIGIDNKPSYTNFTDVFDNPSNDAIFIWSSNIKLDNLVLLRKTIQ